MNNWPFILRTAWRDSRKNRGRLLLFMSSIILGVAALVAINSFNYNLQRDIDNQAATLLGADLVVTGNRPLAEELLPLLDELGAERASKQDMFSMARFPKGEISQFVRLQGLTGNFPFYGQLKTEPASVRQRLDEGDVAIVDNGFMGQHGLDIGDSVFIGEARFRIIGRLLTDFGSANVAAGFAPSVYMSGASLAKTQLIQPGSLVNYNTYLKTPTGKDVSAWVEKHEDAFQNDSQRLETIEGQKENLSGAFANLNAFLNLVALVSLILGCIGVASSVLIYVKSKIPTIAVLRCLGMKGRDVFWVFLVQILGLGALGVLAGTVLGTVVQLALPILFRDFLPLDVTTQISWTAVAEGLTIGMAVTLLFAMVPLLSVRRVSPLRILRTGYEDDVEQRDYARWGVYVGIFALFLSFLWYLTGHLRDAAAFTGGLLLAFLVLFGVARAIVWAVRRFFPTGWNFVFRQGLANLFRPNNQTVTLLVSIGLGTAILTTLFVVQGLLLSNVAEMDAGNQPNVILYGIEKGQMETLTDLTRRYDMPVIQQVPIVTMRITGWQGKTKEEWLADTTRQAKRWAFNREVRTTFRDTLDGFEEVLAGTFPKPLAAHGDTVFVSLQEGYAEDMGLEIGDDLTFNIQGMPLTTYVGSIRKVDFTKMRTRFLILFPDGVLEDAPYFQVLVTKSPSPAATAAYRTEVVKALPNVSVVDLSSILDAVSDVLAKVAYIIQFMAVFSLLTGIIVLVSSLLLSKLQRIRESVLLRTIGASSRQLLAIAATEYALLGTLAALTGIGIALVGSWVLATFQFNLDFYVPWGSIAAIFVLVVLLIISIGLLNNRDVLRKRPLEVLRAEG